MWGYSTDPKGQNYLISWNLYSNWGNSLQDRKLKFLKTFFSLKKRIKQESAYELEGWRSSLRKIISTFLLTWKVMV